MTIHHAAATAFFAVALGCAHNTSDPRRQAYQKGEQAAAQEIAQGTPSIYGITFGGGPPVDARTGLPMTWFSNCLNDRAIEEFIRGRNDYVFRHVRSPATAANPTTRGE